MANIIIRIGALILAASAVNSTIDHQKIQAIYQTIGSYRPDKKTSGQGKEEPDCGGILTYPVQLRPPLSPNHRYLPDLSCEWVVQAPAGARVHIEIEKFDVRVSQNCADDSLSIYDGDSEASDLLTKACGEVPTRPAFPRSEYSSTGSAMTLKFKTDEDDSRPLGFVINVSFFDNDGVVIPETCSGDYPLIQYPTTITFVDPGAASDYLACMWFVRAPPDKHVRATIVSLDMRLDYDLLNLHDGEDVMSPTLGADISGQLEDIPLDGRNAVVRTTTGPNLSVMVISFWPDDTATDFVLSIEFVDATSLPVCPLEAAERTGTGVLTFPINDGSYVNYANCWWSITTPGMRVAIDIVNMEIEDSEDSVCAYDALYIYDGPVTNEVAYLKLCGTYVPPRIVSHHDSVYIRFLSDIFTSKSGFLINYSPTTEPATIGLLPGGVMEYSCHLEDLPMNGCSDVTQTVSVSSDGLLLSIPSPDALEYDNDMRCYSRFAVSAPQPVVFKFISIDIEESPGCSKDYIEFFDGEGGTAPSLGKYCGRQLPAAVKSTGMSLFMQFVTDSTNTSMGFTAHVYAGYTLGSDTCGSPDIQPITDEEGGIEAMPCSWPWQAAIYRSSDDSFVCSGVIIDKHWIMTTAQCVNNADISDIKVVVGAHMRDYSASEASRQELTVQDIIQFDGYSGYGEGGTNPNLALIQVGQIIFDECVGAVCLAEGNSVPSGTDCTVTGWGATADDGSLAVNLTQAEVTVLADDFCTTKHRELDEEFELCAAGVDDGTIPCYANEGAPLVCNVGGTYVLHGISSWNEGCDHPELPTVYAQLANCNVIRWIKETTGL